MDFSAPVRLTASGGFYFGQRPIYPAIWNQTRRKDRPDNCPPPLIELNRSPYVHRLLWARVRDRDPPIREFFQNRRGLSTAAVDLGDRPGCSAPDRPDSVSWQARVRPKRGGALEICRGICRKTAMHQARNLIGQDLTFPAFEGVERRPHDFHG
jgi:hypothetical protein